MTPRARRGQPTCQSQPATPAVVAQTTRHAIDRWRPRSFIHETTARRRSIASSPVASPGEVEVDADINTVVSTGHVRSSVALGAALGLAGVIAYNWWVLVPFKSGLMRSPNELFSDLEATGQPFADLMRSADFISGALLIAAFLALGRSSLPRARREWNAMVLFAAAGAAGAVFPEACADGVSNTCRHLELTFQLPLHHYLHIVAGIVEFAALTMALYWATKRTADGHSVIGSVYRGLWHGSWVAYPLLGLAYVTNDLGGIMEAVFFIGFTAVIIMELIERIVALHARRTAGSSEVLSSADGSHQSAAAAAGIGGDVDEGVSVVGRSISGAPGARFDLDA